MAVDDNYRKRIATSDQFEDYSCPHCQEVFFCKERWQTHKNICALEKSQQGIPVNIEIKIEQDNIDNLSDNSQDPVNENEEPLKKKVKRPPPPLVHIDQIKKFAEED